MAQTEQFFEDPKVSDLLQNNIKQVRDLEEKEQRRLLKIFRDIRTELQDRLLSIPEGTFTEQQLQVTLVQVQGAIQAIKRDLKTGIVDSSEILSQRGISDLIREIERFSNRFEGSIQPLNINAVRIASDAQNFLINKFESSIEAYGEDLRSAITSNLTQSLALRDTSRRTVSRLQQQVGQFFKGEEFKLERIVRTELHNIYNFSKLRGMSDIKEDAIPDLKKSLIHPIDDRTGEDSKKLASKNPVVEIGEPFRFTFRGEERVFMFPPDRPNDRAILAPFREEWGRRAATFSPAS